MDGEVIRLANESGFIVLIDKDRETRFFIRTSLIDAIGFHEGFTHIDVKNNQKCYEVIDEPREIFEQVRAISKGGVNTSKINLLSGIRDLRFKYS